MTTTEVFVIIFGLILGYWLISKLMAAAEAARPNLTKDQKIDESKPDSKSPQNENENWYVTLGVNPDATPDEIHTAYKSLMSQYHPDKVASLGAELIALAERKSKAINLAYGQAKALHGEQF